MCENYIGALHAGVLAKWAVVTSWIVGFNPTTFRGNYHISANIHKFGSPADRLAAMWPQLTELEIDGFK